MVGVFARTRSQVLGVAMGSLFGGMLLPNFIHQLGLITPWALPNIFPALVMQIPLPLATALVPILMTATWSIGFIIAALWKLPRLEFWAFLMSPEPLGGSGDPLQFGNMPSTDNQSKQEQNNKGESNGTVFEQGR